MPCLEEGDPRHFSARSERSDRCPGGVVSSAGGGGAPVPEADVLHGQQDGEPGAPKGQLQRPRLPQVGGQVPHRLQRAALPRHVEPEDELHLRRPPGGALLLAGKGSRKNWGKYRTRYRLPIQDHSRSQMKCRLLHKPLLQWPLPFIQPTSWGTQSDYRFAPKPDARYFVHAVMHEHPEGCWGR